MPDREPAQKSVDYSRIAFPSDQLTFGQLRKSHPERFDVDDPKPFNKNQPHNNFDIEPIFYLERLLAKAAFEEVLGPNDHIFDRHYLSHEDCVIELNKYYLQYGLSTGMHQTQQLLN